MCSWRPMSRDLGGGTGQAGFLTESTTCGTVRPTIGELHTHTAYTRDLPLIYVHATLRRQSLSPVIPGAAPRQVGSESVKGVTRGILGILVRVRDVPPDPVKTRGALGQRVLRPIKDVTPGIAGCKYVLAMRGARFPVIPGMGGRYLEFTSKVSPTA